VADLAGKSFVAWPSTEAIETFLGVLEPSQERAMTTWTVGGQVVGEAGPGVWIRMKRMLLPNGEEMPLHQERVYFLRWELVTTARLYDALPGDHSADRVIGHLPTFAWASARHAAPRVGDSRGLLKNVRRGERVSLGTRWRSSCGP
jgi:hypothetical protein